MKTIKALILTLLFTGVNYLYAQAPVIDFETVGNDWSYGLFGQGTGSSFEIVANPDPSGINTSDSVACFIVGADAEGWAGVFSGDFPDLTLDATNAIVTVMVWKDVISDFNLKLESPNVDQRNIQNTVTGQWELLTFDYSAYIGETVQTLTVVPDHIEAPRTRGAVIYYDNITFSPVPTARLQVIHNAADPSVVSVDIYLNDSLSVDNFGFREATPFIDVPAGTPINIGIAGPNSTSVADTIKNFTVTLTENETYVAIANGVLDPNSFEANPDGRSTAFTLFIKDMARETGTSSDVDFFALHGSTDAPTVDVIARDVATLVDDAAYGDITNYITVPPAEYLLDITPGNDNSTIVASYTADLSALGGGSAVVFASGFLTPSNDQSGAAFGLFAALANGTVVEFPQASKSRLQVIHNSADPAASTVDIYLWNTDLDEQVVKLDDFGFREATEFVDVPGDANLSVIVAGPGSMNETDQVITTIPVDPLANGGKYVVFANGVVTSGDFAANPDSEDIGFTLLVKSMARETGTGSDVDFFVLHGATDAPTVDVIARSVATLVDDAKYKDITEYDAVPAGKYTLDVTPGNDNSTIVASFLADLSSLGGGSAVVFASGFLTPSANQNGEAFGLFAALANGTVVEFPAISTARLQVIHNAADPAAAEVDIYLKNLATDEQLIKLDDFGFREATPFVDAPADVNLAVIIAGPGSTSDTNQVVTTLPVGPLTNGGKYIVSANGVLSPGDFEANPDSKDIAFTLLVKSMARETAIGNDVDFFVLHGATDAPTVDVIARGGSTLVDDAAYSDITPYITVPPAQYTLDLTLSDGTTLVQSYIADLSGLGGGSAAVFASGFLTPVNNQNGEAFGLFFALADGTVGQFPEGVTSVEEISSITPSNYILSQNYPNPFNPSTTINFSFPNNEFVTLKVYNILGSEVATLVNQELTAGSYEFDFNASNFASGIYFYELKAGNFAEIRKMNLLK